MNRGISPISILALALATGSLGVATALPTERQAEFAEVTVRTGRAGCEVELDVGAAGKTDSHGDLVLREVDPSDHYMHVRCPGDPERGGLVSPRAGQNFEARFDSSPPTPLADSSAQQVAETKIQLRHLVQQAVQLRAQGHFDEAVRGLRDALKLDSENSDLHRELGITFLLDKDWKRARVEMLEAIRHKQDDADAYNGLGYALEKLGDIKAAIPAYRTATRLEPDETSYRLHYLEALGKLAAEQSPKKTSDLEERVRPRRR